MSLKRQGSIAFGCIALIFGAGFGLPFWWIVGLVIAIVGTFDFGAHCGWQDCTDMHEEKKHERKATWAGYGSGNTAKNPVPDARGRSREAVQQVGGADCGNVRKNRKTGGDL